MICGLSAKIDSEMAEWWPELENGQYNVDEMLIESGLLVHNVLENKKTVT